MFGIPLPLPDSLFIYSIIYLHEHSFVDFKLLATIQLLHYSCCPSWHWSCSGHQGLLVGSCIPLIHTWLFGPLLAFNVFDGFLLLSPSLQNTPGSACAAPAPLLDSAVSPRTPRPGEQNECQTPGCRDPLLLGHSGCYRCLSTDSENVGCHLACVCTNLILSSHSHPH